MKVLMIGMDGCHEEVFKRGWTPFTTDLLGSYRHLDIDNDLLSRGWLEIVLGEHASLTTALYDNPKSNGSLDWSTEFSLPQVPGLGDEIKTLWKKLNEMGYSIGVANVPTTFPAPEVDGFFISGGGGGAPVTEAATPELCHPKDILPTLNEHGYIVDDRLYQLVVEKKLDIPKKILDRLAFKNERRVDSFMALNERFKVDFGFIVFKTASVVTETLLNAEYCRRRNTTNAPDDTMVGAAREYYKRFDEQIKRLRKAYPDTEFVFVSDHGTTARTHTVNPNILLQEHGLQRVEKGKDALKSLVSFIKSVVPFSIKHLLKKSAAKKLKAVGGTNFNQAKTVAFCKTTGDWSHGIYINDVKRFGGPVPEAEIIQTRDRIVELINSNPLTKEHGVAARILPNMTDAVIDHFPDIQLVLPNGYLTSDQSPAFISEYIPPACQSSLAAVMRGDILGIKSHTPLAYFSATACENFDEAQMRGDLSVIYDRIVDMFKSSSRTS
ncbi:MAG: alkaline phosphatase family protein [Pseudomonadota bacterium]